MKEFALIAGFTAAAIVLGAGVLHVLPRLGSAGRRLSNAMCRAPLLDLPVTYFTVAPMIVGPIIAGWIGLAGGVVGQIVGMQTWAVLHSLANPKLRGTPRIHTTLNQIVGPFRNYGAVWLTAFVLPVFWLVRMAEIFLYPFIRVLVRFPKYDHGDWVRVGRQKFDGLISHDLIWCLYCDWMTGVWSLGSEMLRNVESFWCPIRFDSEKKCSNCRLDFPDVNGEWVAADGSMEEVTAVLRAKYAAPAEPNSWFGHPARLTVEGESPTVDPEQRT